MPSYNLGELMSWSTKRAGRRADITKSDSSFMVNMAYMTVASQFPDALQEQLAHSSTTSGEAKITLPSDYAAIINLSLFTTAAGSGKTLRMIEPSMADQSGRYPLGTPQKYVMFRDWFELFPTPDSNDDSHYSLQIRYRSQVTDLVEETEVPSVNTDARLAVLYLSEAEHWAYVNQPIEEALARQRYAAQLSTAQNVYARRQHATDLYGVRPIYPEVRPVSKRSFDIV